VKISDTLIDSLKIDSSALNYKAKWFSRNMAVKSVPLLGLNSTRRYKVLHDIHQRRHCNRQFGRSPIHSIESHDGLHRSDLRYNTPGARDSHHTMALQNASS